MQDIFGSILKDYYFHPESADIALLNNSYGDPEEMPIEVFFRSYDEMPEMEHLALKLCKGSILDIGAGAGSHVLHLQNQGKSISAAEISPGACEVMKLRGVGNILNMDVMQLKGRRFDTLLLLMNGIGLSGKLENVPLVLSHLKTLLNSEGQIIFDSSDISYLYEDAVRPAHYIGEISYQYVYKGLNGPWFNWLYIDFNTLNELAQEHGWNCEMLLEDDMDQYLARLTIAD